VWLIEILNVKLGGKFYITFTSNDGVEKQTEKPFDLDISTDKLEYYLCDYFFCKNGIGSTVSITKTYYDGSGGEVSSFADAEKIIFKVSLDKRIKGFSFASAVA
jgi:hypothetical protein